MAWAPVQPKHAIERVRIIIQMTDMFPDKFLRKLSTDFEDKRMSLGFATKMLQEGHEVMFDTAGATQTGEKLQLLSWECKRISAANSIIELIKVEKNSIIFETLEYSSWNNFINRFKEVALPIIKQVSTFYDIRLMSLEYVDRFIYKGNPLNAKPDFLNKKIIQQLGEDAKNGKELWHNYRGWFESLEDTKILINQNIDAHDLKIGNSDDLTRSIQILTKIQLIYEKSDFNIEKQDIELQKMHIRSKEMVISILSEEMSDKIGISIES